MIKLIRFVDIAAPDFYSKLIEGFKSGPNNFTDNLLSLPLFNRLLNDIGLSKFGRSSCLRDKGHLVLRLDISADRVLRVKGVSDLRQLLDPAVSIICGISIIFESS